MWPMLPALVLAFVYFFTNDGHPDGLFIVTLLATILGAIAVIRNTEHERAKLDAEMEEHELLLPREDVDA